MTKIALQLAIFVVAAVPGYLLALGFALTLVLPEPTGRSPEDMAISPHDMAAPAAAGGRSAINTLSIFLPACGSAIGTMPPVPAVTRVHSLAESRAGRWLKLPINQPRSSGINCLPSSHGALRPGHRRHGQGNHRRPCRPDPAGSGKGPARSQPRCLVDAEVFSLVGRRGRSSAARWRCRR